MLYHWVLVQMLRILWFSPLSGIVSYQSPSVCGFLSPLECHVWAKHSWSIFITLAGRRWRKKEINHRGKGRSIKKSEKELEGEILGQQKCEREFFSLPFLVPKMLFGIKIEGQHNQGSNCWCMLAYQCESLAGAPKPVR